MAARASKFIYDDCARVDEQAGTFQQDRFAENVSRTDCGNVLYPMVGARAVELRAAMGGTFSGFGHTHHCDMDTVNQFSRANRHARGKEQFTYNQRIFKAPPGLEEGIHNVYAHEELRYQGYNVKNRNCDWFDNARLAHPSERLAEVASSVDRHVTDTVMDNTNFLFDRPRITGQPSKYISVQR